MYLIELHEPEYIVVVYVQSQESVCLVELHRGTELLVTQKIKKLAYPTLTRFRPEPGFFPYRVFIG